MSTIAPLLMALVRTDQPYWKNAFFAQVSKQARHIMTPSFLHTPSTFILSPCSHSPLSGPFGHSLLIRSTQILAPISCDIFFTVGLLIVSDVFPRHMQALSGAVFNTCAQLGTAIGLSVTQVIASSVTDDSSYVNKSSPSALMEGYRVAFWTMFGWMAAVCLVCVVGLRRVGGIGVKRD